MGGVNLSRRPFVNRRPVMRLAGLLWLVGAGLLVLNVKQYGGHFQGTSDYRQRLTEVDREIREAQLLLGEQDQNLKQINLASQNRQIKFLNSLIDYRTFPWSALFDDLEEVVPLDVRLISVSPEVRLKAEPEKPRRRRRSSTSEDSAAPRRAEPEKALRRNEVKLQLAGVARTEDAVTEFMDILYASPKFRNPFLPGETFAESLTSFSIDVVYLTRPAVFDEEDQPAPSEGEPVLAESSEESAGGRPVEGSPGTVAESEVDEAGGARQGVIAEAVGEAEPLPTSEDSGVDSVDGAPGVGTPRQEAARGAAAGEAASPTQDRTTSRRRQTAAPRDPRSGIAVPGVDVGTEPAADLPGSPETPAAAEDPPGFAQPPASATPQLRNGSLSGTPASTLTTPLGVLA